MKVKVKIDDKELFAKFKAQTSRAKDLTPIMKVVAQDMMTRKDLTFKKQTDPDGNKWQPLSPLTLERRRKRKRPAPTTSTLALQDLGALRAKWGRTVTSNSAQIGSDLPYAATQQFGRVVRGRYKSGKRRGQAYSFTIPARAMVGFTPKQLAGYRRRINNWILKGEK